MQADPSCRDRLWESCQRCGDWKVTRRCTDARDGAGLAAVTLVVTGVRGGYPAKVVDKMVTGVSRPSR
jgi:hypothetical protein